MGDETIIQRQDILKDHLSVIKSEIEKLVKTKDYVEMKIKINDEMDGKING